MLKFISTILAHVNETENQLLWKNLDFGEGWTCKKLRIGGGFRQHIETNNLEYDRPVR